MSASSTTGVSLLEQLREEEARYLMGTYSRQPVAFIRGSGVHVVDSEGREHIDLVAGIAVNVLGHCPAAVRAALELQSSTLLHASNLYYTAPQVEAARLLVETAFPGRVFFCNSGAEANEAAIKIARKWGQRHRGGAYRIVCASGAFHGRTLATLAATGQEKYLAPFAPTVEGFTHVAFDDAGAVADAIDDSVVAVMLEPVLGETGVHPMSDETLRGIRQLCDQRDVLLILDEVQTGMGRTGRWWAHQHAGITPDVMTVAKGLGGGVAIGAVLAAPRADVLEPGDHGCTFGGNPLATTVAAAVMRTITERDLVGNAERVGAHLRTRLEALREAGLPVSAVRGRGLMLAVVLGDDLAPQVARACLTTGVVINAIGQRVLRLVPPLILTETQADEAVHRIEAGMRMVLAERSA
ncbi:MAG TPA: aspartate aminotransferase family protein [Candidatus Dormibacteraeota bacterium]|jgi:acetylornithine/N-succinyldiaminopimelate aminotransferase|nr:aspartate aminotransferase family protein [Candidatus Dormibacteraeota bacterium]